MFHLSKFLCQAMYISLRLPTGHSHHRLVFCIGGSLYFSRIWIFSHSQPRYKNSGSATPIIRTSPSSFEMLLLQRLDKTVVPKKKKQRKLSSTAAIVTSEKWIAAEHKKNKKWKRKKAEKDLKN
ncbi:hypothetical protein JTB14_019158 [Gonioctena quinquepunctata]|nr:hypothetical protein JTB14_019158 [Gonioctena quinquepunctata]